MTSCEGTEGPTPSMIRPDRARYFIPCLTESIELLGKGIGTNPEVIDKSTTSS